MEIKRDKIGARMSQVVSYNGLVFLAGQVADNTDTDVAGQTRDILNKIDALLAEAGTDKTKVLSASVWLSDISTFDQMNSEWDKWVVEGKTPARACVESKLAFPRFTVEIAVVAAV